MDSVLMENKVLNLDKSSWVLTKLGDLAKDISKRVDNPGESEYDRFVGLGNFVSGDIKIKTWETTENLASSAKAFQAGDILFARRNAYLRRASLVDFDGCCSGDAFVLRENHDKVVPGFLAFLMNSNALWDYANSNAAGTMSKRVKWRDLAEYEFLLPPKDQQARLAELLWTMDDVIESEKELSEKFQVILFSSLKEIFHKNTDTVKLIDLCLDKPKYGANSPAIEYDQETRYLRITDIGELGELNLEKVSAEKHEDKYLLKYGDFLLARSADPGRAYYYKEIDGRCTHAGYLIKFSLDMTKVLPEYLCYFTQTKGFKNWITQTTRTGTLSNINSQEFSRLLIPITSVEKQIEIVEEITGLYSQLRTIKSKLNSSLSLQKSLINQVF